MERESPSFVPRADTMDAKDWVELFTIVMVITYHKIWLQRCNILYRGNTPNPARIIANGVWAEVENTLLIFASLATPICGGIDACSSDCAQQMWLSADRTSSETRSRSLKSLSKLGPAAEGASSLQHSSRCRAPPRGGDFSPQ